MREISERERERYQRNLLVDGFGEQGQSRLLESRVTVVGAGRGSGSAVLNYLGGGRGGAYPDRIESEYGVRRAICSAKCCTRLAEIGGAESRGCGRASFAAESRLPLGNRRRAVDGRQCFRAVARLGGSGRLYR